MFTEGNWIKTNILGRLTNKQLDFEVQFNLPSTYQDLSFSEACNYTAKHLATVSRPIYLSLSGGLDSSFVFKCLYWNSVPFKPIIVVIKNNSANFAEIKEAFYLCKEFKIDPIVVRIDEKQHLQIYNEEIFTKLNGAGLYSVPTVIAAELAAQTDNSLLITGDSVVDERYPGTYKIHEYNVYSDINKPDFLVPFFLFSYSQVRATIRQRGCRNPLEFKQNNYNDFRIMKPNGYDDPTIIELSNQLVKKLLPVKHSVFFDNL